MRLPSHAHTSQLLLLACLLLAAPLSTRPQQQQQQQDRQHSPPSPDPSMVYLQRMALLPPPASRPWHSSLQHITLNAHPLYTTPNPLTSQTGSTPAGLISSQDPTRNTSPDTPTQNPSLDLPSAHTSSHLTPHSQPQQAGTPPSSSSSSSSSSSTPSLDPATPFPLAPLLASWQFTLPEPALRKGTGYMGSNHRLRRVVRDGLRGRPIKIGAVGGSITFGDKAAYKGVTDWVSLIGEWAAAAFRNATTLNGAMPGTPSSYMVMCLEHSVDSDTDVVFVEYNLNDGWDDQIRKNERLVGYEKLVRRIMALPKRPAVVLMQMPRHGAMQEPHEFGWQPFHASLEFLYSSVAQYYDVQYLSFRSATNRLALLKKAPGFLYSDLMEPYEPHTHPMDAGHKVMADLAVWLFQQTAVDLVLRPWGRADVEQMTEGLPPPMIPGNTAPTAVMCVQGNNFQQVVTSAVGWEFVNEGTATKPKTGYVSTTPGSVLMLMLDTMRPGSVGKVVVSIGHLRSYEHMGFAGISCVSGCHCKGRDVDAHHDMKVSQTYLATVEVSQHANCSISIEVLGGTNSGEHKFKVTGIMVSDTADPPRPAHMRDGVFMDPSLFLARNQDPNGFGKWLRKMRSPSSSAGGR